MRRVIFSTVSLLFVGILFFVTTLANEETATSPARQAKVMASLSVAQESADQKSSQSSPKADTPPPAVSAVKPLPPINNGQPGLSIDRALQIAYKQSPLILEAADAVQKASGYEVQTRSLALPRLVVTADAAQADKYQTDNFSGNSESSNVPTTQSRNQAAGSQWSVQLKLIKTIFDAGMARDLIGSAKVSEALANYSMQDVVQQVDLQVRLAFYQVLSQQSRVEVYRDSLSTLQQVSGRIQNQRQFGGANDFNLLRSVVGEDSSQPLYDEALAEYRAAEQQLAILLGLDYDQAQRILFGPGVAGKLPVKVEIPAISTALFRAQNESPLIKKLEMAVEAERLGMMAQAASYYPKINLFGAVGDASLPISYGTQERTNNGGYIIGVSGAWSIFDGGLSKGLEEQAKAQFSSAIHALTAARETSEIGVREQSQDLEIYQRQVSASAPIFNRLQQCEAQAQERAFNGVGTMFELTQTLQVTTNTRIQLLQEIYQLNATRAQLDYLTGTGVSVSQEE